MADVLQGDPFAVMGSDVGQDGADPAVILGVVYGQAGSGLHMEKQQLPEGKKGQEDVKLPGSRTVLVKGDQPEDALLSLLVPVLGSVQGQGRQLRRLKQGKDTVLLDQAVFIAVDQPGIKGNGEIAAVMVFDPASRMKGPGAAEQGLALLQMEGLMVHPVVDLPLLDQGQLDLRMPVP